NDGGLLTIEHGDRRVRRAEVDTDEHGLVDHGNAVRMIPRRPPAPTRRSRAAPLRTRVTPDSGPRTRSRSRMLVPQTTARDAVVTRRESVGRVLVPRDVPRLASAVRQSVLDWRLRDANHEDPRARPFLRPVPRVRVHG